MIWLLCAVANASDIQQFSASLSDQAFHYQAELKLPGMPSIYNLRLHLHSYTYTTARASFGAMLYEDHDTSNSLSVEMRVGSSAFDNTNFGMFDTGYSRFNLPIELTEFAVNHAVWLATDRAYKSSIEQLTRKRAQHSYPSNHPGDYLLTGPHYSVGEMPVLSDPQPLLQTVRTLSAHLAAPGNLEVGSVYLGIESGGETSVDTEGSILFRPLEEVSVQVVAHARADDGALITDTRIWTSRRPEHLPSEPEMASETVDMAFNLQLITKSEPLKGAIIGPVILEGSAARDLFRYLLIPRLEGTPSPLPFDSSYGALGGSQSNSSELGRRILPPDFSVVDDPLRDPNHPSATPLDAEGTAVEFVSLVEQGLVKSLLMSRIPRPGLATTNGHARGYAGDRLIGRASQLVVSSKDAVRRKKLYKAGIKLAQSYGNDFVIVVRKLQEPSVLALDDAYAGVYFGLDEHTIAHLPPPVAIYKRTRDGQETRLRGAQFVRVHQSLLKQIAMTGPSSSGSFFVSSDPAMNTDRPLAGLATAMTAPDVLIQEMEVVPAPGNPRDIRTLRPSK